MFNILPMEKEKRRRRGEEKKAPSSSLHMTASGDVMATHEGREAVQMDLPRYTNVPIGISQY